MNGIFFISDLANLNRLDDTGVTYNSYNSKCGVNHIGMQARRHFGNHNGSTKEVLKNNHLQMMFVWPPAKKIPTARIAIGILFISKYIISTIEPSQQTLQAY